MGAALGRPPSRENCNFDIHILSVQKYSANTVRSFNVKFISEVQCNLAKRGIRDPAPRKYSPLSMCCKNCVESGT